MLLPPMGSECEVGEDAGELISGVVMLFSFPDVLKLDMTQNIIMRAIGIFVFGCGTTVSYYSRKIKNAITI